jgi:DNA-binding response OmpR family regulator
MKKKKTILIVDDEEIIISCIQTFLDGLGYEFISATSGQQALDVLSSQSVDLVLLDVMMPGLDGFAVCKRIKENPRTKNIPVLMVTALKEIEDRIMSMEVGADDFLPKPLEETELQIRVKSLLRIKSYNDELSKSLAELQHKNDRLEHLEELKNDLIHMIVHDLKGPLTLIMVNLDILSVEQDEISPQKLDRLKSATKHCQELQEMIDEILMIAIMEEDKMTLSLASAHLETLTNYVLDSFSKGIKE